MGALNEIPDVQDELNRKVYETLHWLTHSLTTAQITKDQFSTSLDTLFMAVSGLVDRDFIHIITEAKELCQ